MAPVVDCSIHPVQPVLPSKKEQLRQAFALLEDQRSALASCILRWRDVEECLEEAERDLEKRRLELSEKEKAFETRSRGLEEALRRREELVAEKERLLKNSLSGKKQEVETLLDDSDGSSSSTCVEGNTNSEKVTKNVDVNDGATDKDPEEDDKEDASSISVHVSSAKECCTGSSISNKCNSANLAGKASKDFFSSNPKPGDLKLRMHIKELCEKMEGKGLLKYMIERRKDISALRNELPAALKLAGEPAVLVLDALDGYCYSDQADVTSPKESRVSANKRACILLMESFGHMLDLFELESGATSTIKERAKAMADQWRSRILLGGDDGLTINSLDAQAFLQLLVTFGVAANYKKEELCKLVTTVARRRQTPALCRSLGLTENIPDIVDWLANDGKQVEAISLAHAFGIMDQIQPGPLLKAYLKEAKKSAQTILRSGSNTPAALNDSTTKELIALKNVLKCIEEFDLESQFSSTSLQKRVIQLERTKQDRKRVAVAVKAQAKRPRANTVNALSQGPLERMFHRPIDRQQYSSMNLPSYSFAMANNFDRRNQGSYTSAYRAGNCPPIALPASYLYAADGLPSPAYGSPYANPSPSYGSYQFGSGITPPAPPYPAQFLH